MATSPQRKKDRTLEALLRQLEGLAHQHPVVMVVEDALWIDPTSLELLDLTVERVGSLRVLLIVTSVLESGLLRDEKGRYVLDSTLSRFRDPDEFARLVDGATRPPSIGAPGGADRRRDWTRVFLRAATHRCSFT